MDDLPIFLQTFVRLFAAFVLGIWLQTLAPRKADEKAGEAQPRLIKAVPANPCPHARANGDGRSDETK